MNCKRQHADSNVKAHVRGSSPKGLIIQETGAGISIAVQEMVNPEYKSIQTAIIQCVHINHTMHTMFTGPSYYFWALQSPFSKSQGLLDLYVHWELLDILEVVTCKAFQVSHFVVWV